MTLADTLQAKLADWRPAGDGRHSLAHAADDGGWAVTVAADRNESIGTLVWELTVARTAAAPAGLTLKAWADGIASRASGLLEDLKVIEVDTTRDEAVLRSDEPTRKGAVAGYYEVKLHGTGRAVVRRFQADKAAGTRREQVPFALTHEALAKLAGDIAG